MDVNYDIATASEFMFCTWPQIRMERLFLQLFKKKLTSLDKSPPPLNYHKILNSPLPFVPLTKISEKFPPLACPVLNPAPPPPLYKGWGKKLWLFLLSKRLGPPIFHFTLQYHNMTSICSWIFCCYFSDFLRREKNEPLEAVLIIIYTKTRSKKTKRL